MRIATKNTSATIKRTVLVADGPTLPHPYSATGKKFRVERITLTYQLQHGHWHILHFTDAILGGTVLKKDGSDSLNDYSGGVGYTAWDNRDEELPWLVEIINRLRPHGDSRQFHGEFEVEL